MLRSRFNILQHFPYWFVICVLMVEIFRPTNKNMDIQPNGINSPVEVTAYGGCQTLHNGAQPKGRV